MKIHLGNNIIIHVTNLTESLDELVRSPNDALRKILGYDLKPVCNKVKSPMASAKPKQEVEFIIYAFLGFSLL